MDDGRMGAAGRGRRGVSCGGRGAAGQTSGVGCRATCGVRRLNGVRRRTVQLLASAVRRLGTRECISWYEGSRDCLPRPVVDERELLIARIRALLLGYIRSLRKRRPRD